MRTGTLNLPLTYNQIIGLVRQLPVAEKIRLGQEIAKETLDVRLTRLLGLFKTNELSEEIISKEVELVRAELYAKKRKRK